jgi:hypothetical protein
MLAAVAGPASCSAQLLPAIARRVIAEICPADLLRARLVGWLFLSPLVADDALLSRVFVFRLWQPGLATMLATHILVTFQIIFSWHLKLRFAAVCSRRRSGRCPERLCLICYNVSGVRVAEALSSLRSCCSASCQNSASRSSGQPACSHSR